ncbi:metallophosphoesterase family protein [Rhizobium alvei]|uniref:Metallophosphoesterase family protein n=1 Tax=Rhizobium alvei TaxID=1132659 RepID=A0ABT8YQ89_9HYPH|nr:metallophosphoesterase family protein [Rhizobium alvei]MDO6965482.1 metallophosphoesterase family protein [Rhizobium alvei]
MLIALMTDIHANREAFEACLAAAARAGAEKLVILGDIVGYGADPEWCAAKVRDLAAAGAVVLRGNHDQAAAIADTGMNSVAKIAIDWTKNQIDSGLRDFLAQLPLQVAEEDRLYVHADGSAPDRWRYVRDIETAERHFNGTSQTVSFCGHVHVPALYSLAGTGKITAFSPVSGIAIPLLPQRRWLAVVGSVGQPRDDNPSASWALYDTTSRNLTFMRAAYDVEKAAEKIRQAGLPDALSSRLLKGR